MKELAFHCPVPADPAGKLALALKLSEKLMGRPATPQEIADARIELGLPPERPEPWPAKPSRAKKAL
jgi:hypothetical protein